MERDGAGPHYYDDILVIQEEHEDTEPNDHINLVDEEELEELELEVQRQVEEVLLERSLETGPPGSDEAVALDSFAALEQEAFASSEVEVRSDTMRPALSSVMKSAAESETCAACAGPAPFSAEGDEAEEGWRLRACPATAVHLLLAAGRTRQEEDGQREGLPREVHACAGQGSSALAIAP